jgi:hypothetical protein
MVIFGANPQVGEKNGQDLSASTRAVSATTNRVVRKMYFYNPGLRICCIDVSRLVAHGAVRIQRVPEKTRICETNPLNCFDFRRWPIAG